MCIRKRTQLIPEREASPTPLLITSAPSELLLEGKKTVDSAQLYAHEIKHRLRWTDAWTFAKQEGAWTGVSRGWEPGAQPRGPDGGRSVTPALTRHREGERGQARRWQEGVQDATALTAVHAVRPAGWEGPWPGPQGQSCSTALPGRTDRL